jgi:diguanylate cyclase (GGDEF)-like protein/PAS domain S-box-containing protein
MTDDFVNVLLIEDDSIEAGLIRDELLRATPPDVRCEHVQRLQGGLALLEQRHFDVVLLDLNLPDGWGAENLHRVRAAAPGVPVIILTNHEDENTAVTLVGEGAQDYLFKRHLGGELLRRAIRYAIARQRAEVSLRSSEERYALAMAGARDGIWDWDLQTGELHWSRRCGELLHADDALVVAAPADWFERVHADDRVGLENAFRAHLSGETPYLEYEFRIRNGAGEMQWVLCRGVAVRDNAGLPTRVAGSITDISERKAAEARLRHEVLHDTLTGLPNRALFLDRLDLALRHHRREPSRQFAVLFLDLDRFKMVNDSLGHAAGDELLIEFGKRVSMFLRPGDSVARLGGDEFAILLTEVAGLEDATRVADRIHEVLLRKFLIRGKEVYASVSIGIALSAPHYEHPNQMLRDADLAMYRTKSNRAGSYTVFRSFMYESALQRLELETDLRSALSRSELATYYQPIVSLDGLRVIGFEALLRWFHPTRGSIDPEVFVPLAERSGTIGPVSWWTIREACRQVREWQMSDPRFSELSISVNVSSRLLSEPQFAARMTAVLEETGLAPETLHLEITENALLQHESLTIAELAALQATGVKVHLDDFGTGYSSLSYLNRFRYDTIKIDRSFIASMPDAPRSRRIVDALISLATVLGMGVIAEGVETQEQAENLRALNCHVAQGFLFSKAVPPEVAQALLVKESGFDGVV